MKPKEKRINRGYKCAEKPYRKAMRRALREKTTLAALLENVVVAFSEGHTIEIFNRDAVDLVSKLEKFKQEMNEAL